MSECTTIFMRLLWRFYPIAWLTTVIVRGLSAITSWLEDDETRLELASDRRCCAWVGGWLTMAEERLNELIVMKAMRQLKRYHWRPRNPVRPTPARAVRSPEEILRRLTRLIVLYHDHVRLYELRVRKLQRMFAMAELQLETVHHPIDAQSASAGSAGIADPGVTRVGISDARVAPHPAQRIRAPP